MDKKLLLARLDDALRHCEHTGRPSFLGFLSEKEASVSREYLSHASDNYEFFGGYDGALRTVLGLIPAGMTNLAFPIVSLTFSFRKQDKLSHRDFLGAIMGLGLARETIGDILVEEGRAVVFVEPSAAKYILSEINKVGRVGVKVEEGASYPLPEISELKEFTVTVASVRLDCVVASLCSVSRKDAAELIEKEFVSVNSFVCEKITGKVKNGDTISVRKKGRFVIKSVDGVSKKGRTVMIFDKYI